MFSFLKKCFLILGMVSVVACFSALVYGEEAGFSYENGFEETDNLKPWVINLPGSDSLEEAIKQGKVTVNYKGLSEERPHSGKKSLKLDITFNEAAKYCYFRIPFNPRPLIPGSLYASGYFDVKESTGLQVALGYSIFYQGATPAEGGTQGGDDCGYNETVDGWRYYQKDIYATARYVCERGSGKDKGWDVNKNYLDALTLMIRGDITPGSRVAVYIDDLSVSKEQKKPFLGVSKKEEVKEEAKEENKTDEGGDTKQESISPD